jgi:hypothetical protein
MDVTLDLGGAVSAGDTVIQTVTNLLTGTRSATIEVDNNTLFTLTKYGGDFTSGGWGPTGPNGTILQMSANVFSAQSVGGSVMTGTGGWVSYVNDDFSLWFQVQWDNPYLGDNKAGARLGWAQADQYMVRYIVGSGNTGAGFRFILLPNPGSIYDQIKDITTGGFL